VHGKCGKLYGNWLLTCPGGTAADGQPQVRDPSSRPGGDSQDSSLLERGEQEIKAGKGFDLDEVLAEADVLLAGSPK
jgi:hypothetical protein